MTKSTKPKTKYFKRSSSSSRQYPAQEILRRFQRCRSCDPIHFRHKKGAIKRIIRRDALLEPAELLLCLSPYISIKKKTLPDDSKLSDGRDSIGDMEPFWPYTSNGKLKKYKSQLKPKTNYSNSLKLIKFQSKRQTIVIPCFEENQLVIKAPEELKGLYHKDLREEDCDSTGSYIQLGVERGLKALYSAIKARSERRRLPGKNKLVESKLDTEANNYTFSKWRSRQSTPKNS